MERASFKFAILFGLLIASSLLLSIDAMPSCKADSDCTSFCVGKGHCTSGKCICWEGNGNVCKIDADCLSYCFGPGKCENGNCICSNKMNAPSIVRVK
ncbi:unnamed protein product [Amaranthus hypochondriacus]